MVNNKPKKTYRAGNIKINLWENQQPENKVIESFTFIKRKPNTLITY